MLSSFVPFQVSRLFDLFLRTQKPRRPLKDRLNRRDILFSSAFLQSFGKEFQKEKQYYCPVCAGIEKHYFSLLMNLVPIEIYVLNFLLCIFDGCLQTKRSCLIHSKRIMFTLAYFIRTLMLSTTSLRTLLTAASVSSAICNRSDLLHHASLSF